MNELESNVAAPRRILLATDLSARGDRALERAITISRRHGAQLVILHAYEELNETPTTEGARAVPSWRRPPDVAAMVKQRIRQGLRADLCDAVEGAIVRIEEGNPAEVIEQVATSERIDLIVVGIARESPFSTRPVILGKTVEQLLRHRPEPILIVRNRARDAYRHVVVATDFSEPSAYALQLAVRFFRGQRLYLLHAFEPPYSTLVDDAMQHMESYRALHAEELKAFLASVFLPEGDRERLVSLIEPGSPQRIIREYVHAHDADLVVLGTRGRGAVLEALLGSTTKSILSTLPCDALVVTAPRK